MPITEPIPHPNTPRRVLRWWTRWHSFSKVAAKLGVNKGHIYKIIVHGIEPKDPAIRKAIGLRKHIPRPPRDPSKPLPDWLAWWRSIGVDKRREIIQHLHETTQGD